jgi:Lrp/AsnC family transcriptional regulator, regulator for asnA, asnC and gidA
MTDNNRKSRKFVPDELDMRICQELVSNVSQSSRDIGEKIGIPHTTVRRRINKLVDNNILHILAMPNPIALGYDIWVIIELAVKHGQAKAVSQALLKYKFCYLITESIGNYNIILGARFRRMEDLTEFLYLELTKFSDIERYNVNFLVNPVRFYDYSFLTEDNHDVLKEYKNS